MRDARVYNVHYYMFMRRAGPFCGFQIALNNQRLLVTRMESQAALIANKLHRCIGEMELPTHVMDECVPPLYTYNKHYMMYSIVHVHAYIVHSVLETFSVSVFSRSTFKHKTCSFVCTHFLAAFVQATLTFEGYMHRFTLQHILFTTRKLKSLNCQVPNHTTYPHAGHIQDIIRCITHTHTSPRTTWGKKHIILYVYVLQKPDDTYSSSRSPTCFYFRSPI